MRARIVICAGAVVAMAGCASDQLGTGIALNTQQGTTISASKTAAGKLTKTIVWTLQKTVSPAALSMPAAGHWITYLRARLKAGKRRK